MKQEPAVTAPAAENAGMAARRRAPNGRPLAQRWQRQLRGGRGGAESQLSLGGLE